MLKAYQVAPFEPVSTDYSVSLAGESLHVYPVRFSAMATNQIFRGKQRGIDETELASYVHFEGDEAASLTVDVNFDVFCASVVPASAGVKVLRNGRRLQFTLEKCGSYVLEVNGVHKPLHIFFDPPETQVPDQDDPNVLYYGPGLHNVGLLRVQSGQTLYLAGGARLMGGVIAEHAAGIRIMGRGVIDTSLVPRQSAINSILLVDCRDVTVEGVILHDAPCFSLKIGGGGNHRIDGVKVIGQWRYNADGIDLYNTHDVRITNCFVRTFDDCIVLKGGHEVGGMKTNNSNVEDILVERCVLWNDWGRALEIGAETCADEMHRITFRNCDVLHFLFMACDVQACGDALVHDVLFEDIRVGEPLDPQCEPRLCEIFIRPMCWIKGDKMGRVEGITFRRIAYTGRTMVPCRMIGYQADSDVRDVRFEEITINGEALGTKGHPMCRLIANELVSGVTVDGVPVSKEELVPESEEETCNRFLIGNGAFITL